MKFPELHTCPTPEIGDSPFWPLTWEKPKKYEPSWLRLCEVNVEANETAHLDDVQCFIAFLDYIQKTGLQSWHMTTTKYLTPVEQARLMLEMLWGIQNGSIKTKQHFDIDDDWGLIDGDCS